MIVIKDPRLRSSRSALNMLIYKENCLTTCSLKVIQECKKCTIKSTRGDLRNVYKHQRRHCLI